MSTTGLKKLLSQPLITQCHEFIRLETENRLWYKLFKVTPVCIDEYVSSDSQQGEELDGREVHEKQYVLTDIWNCKEVQQFAFDFLSVSVRYGQQSGMKVIGC